jgi:hypothetical protein
MRQTGVRTGLTTLNQRLAAGSLLLSMLCCLHASPLNAPRRLVNGQVIDLKPLFTWWTNRSGPRPLSSWVHLTGRIVGTNTLGWIVEAKVDATAGHSTKSEAEDTRKAGVRMILQRPPLDRMVEFEKLNTELKTLTEERERLVSQQSQARTAEQFVSREVKYDRNNSRLLAQEDRQLRQLDDQVKNQLRLLDQKTASLKKQLADYPSPDHYEVDCFALKCGSAYEQLPVYDHGVAYP